MHLFLLAANKIQSTDNKMITKNEINSILDTLKTKCDSSALLHAEKGIQQAAALWTKEDGSKVDFVSFCLKSFINSEAQRDSVFQKISFYFEQLNGNYNEMQIGLQYNVHLNTGPLLPVDEMFSAYSPNAHFTDDMFANKIAFYIIINFPHYTLSEKNNLGANWTRKQWAYARLGDSFTSRVPAKLQQNIADALADADLYIAEYNIMAGRLLSEKNEVLFPSDLKLLSHWNLRDEIKSNYGKEGGLEKQRTIYEVMKHIVNQDIPNCVINDSTYQWNPYSNKVFEGKNEVKFSVEPNTRYQKVINNFNALRATDEYYVDLNDYIKRNFEGEMEVSQEEVEKLFIAFISAPEIKQVGALIKSRLNRDLQPFDIWYDGFKERSTISNEELDKLSATQYPTTEAFQKDIPNILQKLGFDKNESEFIASKVAVDAARGSGHALGSLMHSAKSHLRTRVEANGMNYKGYNIAMHEFGHNVEQTISLHDVDYYVLAGVPNTSFTEALAFIFQRRDLDNLGKKNTNPMKDHLMALDNVWSLYEIMGVSLLDMQVWKWLYAHPNTTSAELKDAVISMSKEIWNTYYAHVFGIKDQTILAIYSHMIAYPLYLSAYSYGHLIDFQLEQHLKNNNFGSEVKRIFRQGQLTPKEWMIGAVGEDVSIQPMLQATKEALKYVK